MTTGAAYAPPTHGSVAVRAVRLDKWLWAARFFKTRALAAGAVEAGKVRRNGQPVKSAHHLVVGDRLVIRIGMELFEIEVLALSGQRRPAAEARLLYLENEESQRRRQQEQEIRKLTASQIGFAADAGRPSKRNRRKIVAFVRKGENHEKD